MGKISVEEFEKAVEMFGFDSPVVTAIWNTMNRNPANRDEWEEVFDRYMAHKYTQEGADNGLERR